MAALRRLVLSAHFDDAVLSCWRAIAGTADPAVVTVATVFAGAPPEGGALGDWDRACGASDPGQAWSARCAEDRAALERIGARVLHLPFVDSPYRTGPAPRAAVTEALDQLVQGFDEVWIPAGIGDHGDHTLVAAAALQVSGGRRRRLYADLPYAASRGWSALVDAARRGHHDEASLRASMDASPFLPPSTVPVLADLSAAERAEKLQALVTYTSQLPQLIAAFGRWFDDPDIAPFELAWDPGPGPRPGRPIDTFAAAVAVKPADHRPSTFLTAVVRTLGNSPDALAATLAGLARQTCTDVQIILLHHLAQPTGTGPATQRWHPGPALPESLAGCTRVVDVVGGTKAAVLNTGIDLAVSRYVAILDEDNLALENWVDTFRVMAGRHPETVLRARVSAEHLDAGGWQRNDDAWPESFDLIDHLNGDASPSCGVAFPLTCFTELSLRFDESLTVGEDADLLLRAAALCGVTSSPTTTSVCRRWNRQDESPADADVREDAINRVIANADQRPLLLPPGTAGRLRRDHAALLSLTGRATDAERECQRLAAALTQAQHDRQQLIDIHARALTEITEQHAQQVAAVIGQITREFHASTSWRVTAPLRAVGALRLKITRRRHPPEPPEPPDSTPGPATPSQHDTEEPPPAIGLKPPPDPGVYTWPARNFEDLYASHPDPWGYTTSWYEQRKYAITLACLPNERFRRAFEPGCSIGVLSERLAHRTDALICADFATGALVHARQRLAPYPHVDVRLMIVPTDWPDGHFDLIVISEIATYLSDDDLTTLVQRTVTSLDDQGYLILVHYRPPTGTPHTAAEVHHRFRDHPHLEAIANHEEPEFLLDILQRQP